MTKKKKIKGHYLPRCDYVILKFKNIYSKFSDLPSNLKKTSAYKQDKVTKIKFMLPCEKKFKKHMIYNIKDVIIKIIYKLVFIKT